jgi:membrane dipeptidase
MALRADDCLEAVYHDAIVIDALASPSAMNVAWPPEGPLTPSQVDRVRQSRLTAVNVTVGDGGQSLAATLRCVEFWEEQVAAHGEAMQIVRAPEDILSAKRAGRLGLIFGTQDTSMLGGDAAVVSRLASAGIGIVQLTYNEPNDVGSGCLAADDSGLTPFGHQVIEALDSHRLIIDLSHAGPRTAYEGATAAYNPPVITHTGCRSVFAHPRNTEDRTLRLIADRGGVVGIFLMPFLGGGPGPATPPLLIEHLEHALHLCGSDHVGIGSDQSISPIVDCPEYWAAERSTRKGRRDLGIAAPGEDRPVYIPELNSPRRLEQIALALSRRGHCDDVIEKVIGANWHRVFGEVWASAPHTHESAAPTASQERS